MRWPLARLASIGCHRGERQPCDLCRVRAGRARQRARRGEVRLQGIRSSARGRPLARRAGVPRVIDGERVRVDLEQDPVEQELSLRAPQKRDRGIDRDARSDERVQERVREPRARAVTLLDPATKLQPQHRRSPRRAKRVDRPLDVLPGQQSTHALGRTGNRLSGTGG